MAADLEALLRRVAQHDQAALASLYDATARHVYGLALRVLENDTAAAAVTERAYRRVWEQAARYDSSALSVLGWILQITRDLAVDDRRRTRTAEAWAAQAPPDERRLLELAYFGGFTLEELAAMLGHNVDQVKAVIRTGMDRLRGALVS